MSTPPEKTPEEIAAEDAAKAEQERIVAENKAAADEHAATKAEAARLKKENEDLVAKAAAAEAKAARTVPAPTKKAEKVPQTPAPEAKRRRRLAWFPESDD